MQWGYTLACIPLLPLLATPIPNLPLYYCGYKVRPSSLHLARPCIMLVVSVQHNNALELSQPCISQMRAAVWLFSCVSLPHRYGHIYNILVLQSKSSTGFLAWLHAVHRLPLRAQAFSASSALSGCAALRNMLSHAETQQLQALREKLQALQASGVVFPTDSWPARLLRPEPRCAALL